MQLVETGRAMMAVFGVAGVLVGCGTTARVNPVAAEHVTERLVVMESAETGTTWRSLCARKECEGPAMTYTKLSHDAAVLHESARQLEESLVLGYGAARYRATIADLQKLTVDLLEELDHLDANRDFAGNARRTSATVILRRASYHVRDAENRLGRISSKMRAQTQDRPDERAQAATGSWPAL